MRATQSDGIRPPAVPLVTVDPYFSIWSMADRLCEDHTRHWTTARMAIVGLARIDGRAYRFCGRGRTDTPNWSFRGEPPAMYQQAVRVDPLSTRYRFVAGGVELTVRFLTPLLIDDLDVLSRPVSYVSISAVATDGKAHDVSVYLDLSAEAAVDTPDQVVQWSRRPIGNHGETMFVGTLSQNVLGKRGDDVRIDWGYAHMLAPHATASGVLAARDARYAFVSEGRLPAGDHAPARKGDSVESIWPVLAAVYDLGQVAEQPTERTILLGYDDCHSIEYFGERLSAYCFRNGATFDDVLRQAVDDAPELFSRCDAFDEELLSRARSSGGEEYADICSLAYRQAIAAHKLVADRDGSPLFFSKECFSNGSIGTVDVTYPSTPLFFEFNPDLVEAMLAPVFRFAASEAWPKPYAPHDVGTYPRANGQTYGVTLDGIDENRQMPVEECGNMLILTAVLCRVRGSSDIARRNAGLLEQWAAYLLDYGYDPEHQLCTDDFAGHLARNTNLSVKTIVGLAAFGEISELLGDHTSAATYRDAAKEFAERWESETLEGDHHRLTFDSHDSWSLKYNLIWDLLLGYELFSPEVFDREVDWYLRCRNRYGTPLDSRRTFTKADWIVWSASLASDDERFRDLMEPVWLYLDETPSRTPFSDWYDTVDAAEQTFHHRSVVGGMFMKLWKDRMLSAGGS